MIFYLCSYSDFFKTLLKFLIFCWTHFIFLIFVQVFASIFLNLQTMIISSYLHVFTTHQAFWFKMLIYKTLKSLSNNLYKIYNQLTITTRPITIILALECNLTRLIFFNCEINKVWVGKCWITAYFCIRHFHCIDGGRKKKPGPSQP